MTSQIELPLDNVRSENPSWLLRHPKHALERLPKLLHEQCPATKAYRQHAHSSSSNKLQLLSLQLLDTPPSFVAAAAAGGAGSSLHEPHTEAHAQSDAEDDKDDDYQADPLQLAPVARLLVRNVELLVAVLKVHYRVIDLLLSCLDGGVLLNDDRVEVLDQDHQLVDGSLDFEELVVACADVSKHGVGLAGAIASELQEGAQMSAYDSSFDLVNRTKVMRPRQTYS